jgi:hypothetical protein
VALIKYPEWSPAGFIFAGSPGIPEVLGHQRGAGPRDGLVWCRIKNIRSHPILITAGIHRLSPQIHQWRLFRSGNLWAAPSDQTAFQLRKCPTYLLGTQFRKSSRRNSLRGGKPASGSLSFWCAFPDRGFSPPKPCQAPIKSPAVIRFFPGGDFCGKTGGFGRVWAAGFNAVQSYETGPNMPMTWLTEMFQKHKSVVCDGNIREELGAHEVRIYSYSKEN